MDSDEGPWVELAFEGIHGLSQHVRLAAGVKAVYAGGEHTLVLMNDGTARSFGLGLVWRARG